MDRRVITLLFLPAFFPLPGGMAGATAHPDTRAELIAGSQTFACDLYARLRDTPGNLFFCPFSISAALTMTSAGARGSTEEAMARVLHLPDDRSAVHAAFGRIIADLNAQGRVGDLELDIANGLRGQKGYPFRKEFLDLVRSSYEAGFREADFRSDPEGERQAVNAWVEEMTKNRIRQLFAPGIITSDTRLVLANAIYFKGKWEDEFRPETTVPAPFKLLGDKTVDVPMMNRFGPIEYAETDELQVAVLPYRGRAVSMVIFLPREADGIRRLERKLSPEFLSGTLEGTDMREVVLALPKFTFTQSFDLTGTLKAMGMKELFTPGRADLSGMDGGKELSVSAVVHKAFVEVNEEGTEAAAATGVTIEMESAGPPPPVFRADHPFIFLLRENAGGTILFMGRIESPLVKE